jgi:hypothetical protein
MLNATTERTPGPWVVTYFDDAVEILDGADCGVVVGVMVIWGIAADVPDHREADAAFIFAACNNYERVCAERDELAKVLRAVGALDPSGAGDGFNEWGEATCFNQAQMLAGAALAKVQP